MGDAPGILSIESEALNILRKAAVAGGSEGAVNSTGRGGRGIAHGAGRRVIKRQGSRDAAAIRARGIDVAIGVGGVGGELLRGRREGTAKHRFVDEVDAELEGMVTNNMA